MDGFIKWLNEWEEEVASKTISSEDSAKCLLSPATRDGWKINVSMSNRYQENFNASTRSWMLRKIRELTHSNIWLILHSLNNVMGTLGITRSWKNILQQHKILKKNSTVKTFSIVGYGFMKLAKELLQEGYEFLLTEKNAVPGSDWAVL